MTRQEDNGNGVNGNGDNDNDVIKEKDNNDDDNENLDTSNTSSSSLSRNSIPHCTVCSIALLPTPTPAPATTKAGIVEQMEQVQVATTSTIDTQNEQPFPVSFVALKCTGNCHNSNGSDMSYYCVPDCWEHFLQFHWGMYSGLGQAHLQFSRGLLGEACGRCKSDMVVLIHDTNDTTGRGSSSLSLEESLTRLSPQLLARALTIFQQSKTISTSTSTSTSTTDTPILPQQATTNHLHTKTDSSSNNNNNDTSWEMEMIGRLTLQLEEERLLRCPSCKVKFAITEDRGCDAAWCEHCGRAFCLYCLMDCGDCIKTDPTARPCHLVGDAHDHVLNNDCGWTAGKGMMHSGSNLMRHHEQQFLHKVSLRLKRVPEKVRLQVCHNLQLKPESLEHDNNDKDKEDGDVTSKQKKQQQRQLPNLAQLGRQLENDKWIHYPSTTRAQFLHAAYMGQVAIVKCLLESGIPCHIPDVGGGETALHFAAAKGHAHVIQVLLEWGANPWQLSPPGRIPLDDLCNVGSACTLEAARCLVQACMIMAPVAEIVHSSKNNSNNKRRMFPWLRPWPNGMTALASAKKHHPNSPVGDYFVALDHASYQLNKACVDGNTELVNLQLSNTTNQVIITTTNDKDKDNDKDKENKDNQKKLPPAQDLIWIYNQGSGCTPLLDLCAKVTKLSPTHVLASAKRILKVAQDADNDNDSSNNNLNGHRNSIRTLLHMRDFQFHATALHWLALDVRPPMLQVVGLFLQHAGNGLLRAVDKRGQTPLDWAKTFALDKEDLEQDNVKERKRQHVERWQAIMLAWDVDV